MSKVTFKATSTAIVLLKGKGRHAQFSNLPDIRKLLALALYPTQIASTIGAPVQRVTLEMQVEGDNGIYATALRDVAIPTGMIPDINLAAYTLSIHSESYNKDQKETLAHIADNGGKEMFKTYEINLILHVEDL